jgi:hypothetical protein
MKAKVIVAFLLSIVTASSTAFTVIRRKLPNHEPPHVAMVGVSTDNPHTLADPTPSSAGEVGRNAIFAPAAKSHFGRMPGFDPNASQSYSEIDGPRTAKNRTVDG